MTAITIYPRLYATRHEGGESIVISEGDATIATLYDLYVNRTVNTTTWTFRSKVLDAALRLFGRFDEWLLLQSSNNHLVGYNLEFIQDTLDFTRTGQRRMSLETWLELLHEQDDVQSNSLDKRAPRTYFSLQEGENTVQILQNWCAQPGGFQDLICTLQIFFGRSRRTL